MTEAGDGLFDRLAAYREDVFRVCLGFSRDAAAAEDLCQDVFLKAFARGDSLRNPDGSRIWLLRIARTTCLDRIRYDSRRPTISLDRLPGLLAAPIQPAQARFTRLLAVTKLVAVPDPRGVLAPVILDVLGNFVLDKLGHDEFRSGRSGSISHVAAALSAELIDLQIYLQTAKQREALQQSLQEKMTGAPKK